MLANFTTSHHKIAFVFFLLSVPNSVCCCFSYNLIHSMFCWINCTYEYKASQLLEISNYCAIKLRVIKTCAHLIFTTILIRLQSTCSQNNPMSQNTWYTIQKIKVKCLNPCIALVLQPHAISYSHLHRLHS